MRSGRHNKVVRRLVGALVLASAGVLVSPLAADAIAPPPGSPPPGFHGAGVYDTIAGCQIAGEAGIDNGSWYTYECGSETPPMQNNFYLWVEDTPT